MAVADPSPGLVVVAHGADLVVDLSLDLLEADLSSGLADLSPGLVVADLSPGLVEADLSWELGRVGL